MIKVKNKALISQIICLDVANQPVPYLTVAYTAVTCPRDAIEPTAKYLLYPSEHQLKTINLALFSEIRNPQKSNTTVFCNELLRKLQI